MLVVAVINVNTYPFMAFSNLPCHLDYTGVGGFVEYESFLEWNSPDIHALCETNLDDSIDYGNFSGRGYLSLI